MSKHMKRLTAPVSWPVSRKSHVWVTKPAPGPHAVRSSIPLLVIIRDLAGYCDTAREARRIIGQRKIFVDGIPVTDYFSFNFGYNFNKSTLSNIPATASIVTSRKPAH